MFNYKISFAQNVSLDDDTFNQAIDAMYDIRFEDEASEELRNKFASSKWDINYRDFFINVSMEEELEAQEMAEAAVWFSDVLKIFTVRVTKAQTAYIAYTVCIGYIVHTVEKILPRKGVVFFLGIDTFSYFYYYKNYQSNTPLKRKKLKKMFNRTSVSLATIAITFFVLLALAVFTPLVEIILSGVAIILITVAFAAMFLSALAAWSFTDKED